MHTVQQRLADLRVRDFAPAEHDRDLDLVSLLQQLGRGPRFEVHIVVIDLGLHAHFAELNVLLVLLGFALFLGLFVLEPAKVHEPRDRWAGLCCHLHQVYFTLARHLQRICGPHNADLAAFLVDHTQFRYADAFVDPRLGRRRLRWYF